MQESNFNYSGSKKNAINTVEAIPQLISKEDDPTSRGSAKALKRRSSSPDQRSNSKNRPKLKVSKATGRYPYSELLKVNICVGINYENSRLPGQFFSGNIDTMKDILRKYNIPNINESNPVAITLLVKDQANLPQFKVAISEITKILYYYLLKRIRKQLLKIPDQLLTTEFSAAILCIRHESFLEILEEGKIPSHRFGNFNCVKSIDLFKYKEKIDESREIAFQELLQGE